MICMIYKILVLVKITIIFKRFIRSIIDFCYLKNNYLSSRHIMMENRNPEKENIINDVRNLFR